MCNCAVQTLVLASVGAASKAFMHILSSTHVEGGHILEQALQRPSGQVRPRAFVCHTTSCKQEEIFGALIIRYIMISRLRVRIASQICSKVMFDATELLRTGAGADHGVQPCGLPG